MISVTYEMGFARRVADLIVFLDFGETVKKNVPEKLFELPDSVRCQDFLKQILHH